MTSFLGFILSHGTLVFFVMALSVCRGAVLPDYRYGIYSVALILAVYPLLIAASFMSHSIRRQDAPLFFLFGIFSLAISQVAATIRYGYESGFDSVDSTTLAVSILSFVSMSLSFSAIWLLILLVKQENGLE